jgi:hypothetical protein
MSHSASPALVRTAMMCVQFSLSALLYGIGSNITASDMGSLPIYAK